MPEVTINEELKTVIGEIYNEKLHQKYPFNVIDLAEAVESLAIDIYSENKRFIYELIQNADDAALNDQSELLIKIEKGFIIIAHNGRPFNARDLRGLCGIGRGTKRGSENKTGYKGIGFKSVFGQPDGLVFVKSKDLVFRFDRHYIHKKGWNTNEWGDKTEWETKNDTIFKAPWQLIPILTEPEEYPDVEKIISTSDYNVTTIIKIQKAKKLVKDIQDLPRCSIQPQCSLIIARLQEHG